MRPAVVRRVGGRDVVRLGLGRLLADILFDGGRHKVEVVEAVHGLLRGRQKGLRAEFCPVG